MPAVRSLRARLGVMWGLSLIACLAVGGVMVALYRESTAAQVARAEAVVAHACDLIRDRYDFYTSGWQAARPDPASAAVRGNLAIATGIALAHQPEVEGGIWQGGTGPLAYAYPTYQGSAPKTDLPAAERARIEAINLAALRDEASIGRRHARGNQTLLLHACLLPGPIPRLTGWAMTRVHDVPGFRPLAAGLAVLAGLVLTMAVWLGGTLLTWNRHLRGIEQALAAAGPAGIPALDRTGERELDRIIDALNDAGERLEDARAEAAAASARAERAERLAGLGRVAAGVAHEIRNPIAAARLQGENALAGDDARRAAAIGDMLGQLARLEGLTAELLAMTQRRAPAPQTVDLGDFLAERAAAHAERAAAGGVALHVAAAAGTAWLDPAMIGRVLDNLLTNAIRHAPPGGRVTLAAERGTDGTLALTVADTGPGIAPDIAGRLFEPFVTGRPDGTGLGLAIARELADAHGGRLFLRAATEGTGAVFVLELPPDPDGV